MSRGRTGAAPPVFELRSASMTLVVMALKTTDMQAIEQALVERFADTPGMFDHDPVVIDVAQAEGDPSAIDWSLLAALVSRFDMVAAAVRGGTPEQTAAALSAGLGRAPAAAALPRTAPSVAGAAASPGPAGTPAAVQAPAAPAPAPVPAAAAAPARVAGPPAAPAGLPTLPVGGSMAPTAAAPAAAAGAAATPPAVTAPAVTAPSSPTSPAPACAALPPAGPPATTTTLIVDRPLRSGQQVYARGGDLVVLAAVNSGAEVIADGSIHVYAPLRGKAIAGAKGDRTARIFSTCMEPQLIAVAGTYRTTDSPLPANVLGRVAQIRLDGERLVFEPLG